MIKRLIVWLRGWRWTELGYVRQPKMQHQTLAEMNKAAREKDYTEQDRFLGSMRRVPGGWTHDL